MSLPYINEIKVTHDPTGSPVVLVAWDTYLTNLPLVNGAQVVQVADLVRAAAAKTFSRGNDKTTYSVGVRTYFSDVALQHEAMFTHITSTPRATETIRFSVRDGNEWDLSDATVQAFPARVGPGYCDTNLVIVGGLLAATS